jgi:hypothetical protein
MRWNGTSWAAIEIKADGNFDTNPYVAALMDLTEGAPNGTFMSILVRDLVAKTAMIERIQAELIQIQNAIFGGERFTKSGDSVVDNGADKTGFKLGADGRLIASNAEISGKINANAGEFTGSITPLAGIYNSWYWGVAVDKTQNDWFQTFKDRIEVGKRLNVFGGAVVKNETTGNWVTGIFCFIERLDVNNIELNLFPISGDADRMLIARCTNGNTNAVSRRYYIGW